MSEKCCFTESVMSIVNNSVPIHSHNRCAFERVRCVVPKQGMVTVIMSLIGRERALKALAHTSSARVESSPPEMPITADFALV